MSKKKETAKKVTGTIDKQKESLSDVKITTPAFLSHPAIPYVIIFLFSCLVYSNTVFNLYAIDDVIVLTDNEYTKKGFAGIKDHFTHDMFEGFFGERGAKLVSGGRYRPLSMVTLAIEYGIYGMKPHYSHAINILLFAATCLILYPLLLLLMPLGKNTPFYLSVPFITTILYAAHPLHTEAVANIKGRDEIMCLLFSLAALYAAVQYVRKESYGWLLSGVALYFLALMSKENAITFFAVIPLTFYFFTQAKPKHYLITVGLYLIPAAIFLWLRSMFTQAGITQDSPEVLNNPFLYATSSQRYATAILTFLYYFKLLIFPHPLTHDYYYNQIPYVDLGDGLFLLSFVVNAGLVIYALINFTKKSVVSYAILFYYVTFSVASNILFTVGVLMNERFVYMSSLGFCLLLAYLLVKYASRTPRVVLGAFLVITALYSAKTFARNYDWKDSFTLFRRDVHHSPNSAKIQTSLGGDLGKAAASNIALFRDSGEITRILRDLKMDEAQIAQINLLPDSSIRKLLYDSSIAHLQEAVRIYPTHSNAWLLMGNSYYQRNHDPREVIPIYEKAAAFRVGGYYDASYNLGVVYNDINEPMKAKENLLKAYELKPEQLECRFLLAQVYAKLNREDSMLVWLKKGAELKPVDANDYYLIGTAFGKTAGNLAKAIEYLNKAIQMNPKVELYYEDLGVAYGLSGRFDEAIATSEKLIQLNPEYPAAYANLSVSHRNKGNVKLADEYMLKYQQLRAKYAQ